MTRDQEYGPWIDHDGSGCPCKGKIVQTEVLGRGISEHVAHGTFHIGGVPCAPPSSHDFVTDAWIWDEPIFGNVIRYRIRKPDALRALIAMVENIGAPSQPERVEA